MSIDTQISSHTINPIDIGLAVRACNADAVPGLLNELFALEKSSPIDHEDTRISLLTLASSLINALETPRETMIKHNWAQVCSQNSSQQDACTDSKLASLAWLPRRHYYMLQRRRLQSAWRWTR